MDEGITIYRHGQFREKFLFPSFKSAKKLEKRGWWVVKSHGDWEHGYSGNPGIALDGQPSKNRITGVGRLPFGLHYRGIANRIKRNAAGEALG